MNSQYGRINVKSTEDLSYVIHGDTVQQNGETPSSFYVKKSRNPLDLTVLNDSSFETLQIQAKTSSFYWANLSSFYFVGFAVDEISRRKFTYPRNIYITSDENGLKYIPYHPMKHEMIERKNRLSITPFALIGYYHPRIDLNYERLNGDKSATQVTFSHFLTRDDEYSKSASGFKLGIERKHFFRNEENKRWYASLSLEYFRKNHEHQYRFWIPENLNDDDFTNDTFVQLLPVRKRFISLTPRIGFEQYLTKRLVLDTYVGIGLRYRQTRVVGLNPDLEIEDNDTGWWDVEQSSNRHSNRMAANFDFNFRIGWVF